jgi:DNA replicative helicase MCM subunit Mcm2 (Cdc46/Mcm family)
MNTVAKASKRVAKTGLRILIDSALLARPLSKKEKFDLERISVYLTAEQLKLVKKLVKQKNGKIGFVKKGYSFLLVNKDILPRIDSNLEEAEEINRTIERIYYNEAFKNFVERAWHAIPQYIAPSTIGLKDAKYLTSLLLFTEKSLQVLLLGNVGIGKSEILKDAQKLSEKRIRTVEEIKKLEDSEEDLIASLSFRNKMQVYNSSSLKKNVQLSTAQLAKFHLALILKEPDLQRFANIADKILSEERVKVNPMDLSFIKKYVEEARKINVKVPAEIASQIKDFSMTLKEREELLPWPVTGKTVEALLELVKASARAEMRNAAGIKDLDRVFGIINASYKTEDAKGASEEPS